MLKTLREILLTQYIGSILIALLVWQAAIEFVTSAVKTGFWCYGNLRSESILARLPRPPFPWNDLIFLLITMTLYLLSAYGLARWLYPPTGPTTEPESGQQASRSEDLAS